MLRKLLKYDLKSMFKYWWIVALTSVVLSFAGGICNYITTSEKYDLPVSISIFIVFTQLFVYLGLAAFPLISSVFIYIRFYKNLFTDEGYLTFTLPVKRSQLLNSKLIAGILNSTATAVVFVIDFLIIGLFSQVDASYYDITEETVSSSPFDPLLTVEVFVIFLLVSIISLLFTYCCITFASVVAKKAKLIIAIGIYYGTSTIITTILEVAYLFGGISLIDHVLSLQRNMQEFVTCIILLCIIAFLVLISLILYSFEYFMLDRKLNLS